MPKRSRRLDLRWSPSRLKRFCEKNASWVLELGPRVTPTGIERLYWRHVKSTDTHPDLIGEIARDQRTPRRVLRDLWARFGGRPVRRTRTRKSGRRR